MPCPSCAGCAPSTRSASASGACWCWPCTAPGDRPTPSTPCGRCAPTSPTRLGLDPGEELRALEDAVLRQDPSLRVPGAAPDRVEPRPTPPEAAVTPSEPGATGTAPAALPGREEPLRLTAGAVESVVAGHGQVVLVTGDAGIGKTRLGRAVAAQAAAAGLAVGWGTWEAEGCPPLWGWRRALDVLGEDSPLAPARGVPAPDRAADAASAAFELGGRVAEAVAAGGGVCLVLDDLHWADADSHRLLRRLLAAVADLPLLLVALSRDAQAEVDDVLAASLAALSRTGSVRVALDGLTVEDVARHIRAATGAEVTHEVAERLRARTDGNPFYLQQVVRSLEGTGAFADGAHPGWAAVPGGVRDVVRHRVGSLPPAVGRVLADAAVIGRSFEADVLEAAFTGPADDLDDGLAAAVTAGLVEEDGPGRYRFRHALVRDAVLEDLAGPSRPRAHARVAQALEARRVGRLDEVVARLAEHYRLAGHAHVRSAWLHAAHTAELASREAAHDDASRLLASAVALQADDPDATDGERERLAVARGRALRRVGRVYDAWPVLAGAARSALGRGDAVTAARSLLVVSEDAVWSWRPPHVVVAEAVALWREVLAALSSGGPGPTADPSTTADLRARCTAAVAVELLYARDADEEASRLVDEALDVARRQGDPTLLTHVLNIAHMASHRPHHLLRRIPLSDELVALCLRRHDEVGLAAALWRRGVDRAERGRWADAVADLRRSRDLGRAHHLAPTVLISGYGLVLDHMARGDWDAVDAAIAANEEFEAVMSMGGPGIGQAQRAAALVAAGREVEAAPLVEGVIGRHPTFRDLVALSLVRSGREDEARALLGSWEDQPAIVRDYMWTAHRPARVGVGRPRPRRGGPGSREALAPYADRLATGGMSAYLFGSIHHTLAVLAEAAGDHRAAVGHATRALEVHEELASGRGRSAPARCSVGWVPASRRQGRRKGSPGRWCHTPPNSPRRTA